jgi:DNA-directed RNA polymerase subunit RPC12/RpoP
MHAEETEMREEHLHDAEASVSDDTSIVAAKNASEQPRDNPAGEAAGTSGRAETEVLTLICESCGKDYFFENEQPDPGMKCEKCGGTVFRSFHSSVGDEAADDSRDSTERDLDPDDAEGDVLPGDVMDLNRL